MTEGVGRRGSKLWVSQSNEDTTDSRGTNQYWVGEEVRHFTPCNTS